MKTPQSDQLWPNYLPPDYHLPPDAWEYIAKIDKSPAFRRKIDKQFKALMRSKRKRDRAMAVALGAFILAIK